MGHKQIPMQMHRQREYDRLNPCNPFTRYFNGIGFGLLILLQLISSPIWLLAIIRHPVLVIQKAFRVLISTGITLLIAFTVLYTWDLLMLGIYVISIGLFCTEKFIVAGYTQDLYSWVTVGGESAFENFLTLD